MKYANTSPSIFILAPPLSLPITVHLSAPFALIPQFNTCGTQRSFIHAMSKAVLGHLTKEHLSTQLTTHRPPQWCGYNPNVSHKLGLTASKTLALKKLHKET